MEPTAELRKKLRRLLNEVIPTSGTETDTNFTDEEIDDLLKEAASINEAASQGWMLKAGMIQGSVEAIDAGDETYKLPTLKSRLDFALSMADRYGQLAGIGPDGTKGISIMGRVKVRTDFLC